MHIFTHLKPASQGKTGLGTYPDGMVEHDGMVGQLLKKLDDLGIATTPSSCMEPTMAPRCSPGPTEARHRFRSEKNTNWEGAWRVPCIIRWPGVNQAGDARQPGRRPRGHAADAPRAVGDPDVATKLRKGHRAGDKTFKVHLDGYNLLPYSRARAGNGRARSSSTGAMTET